MPIDKDSGRDFNCKFCERRFARLEHLQRHIRTHTKEKPCKCPCGRSFARVDLLRRHTRLAHAEQHSSPTRTPATFSEQLREVQSSQLEDPNRSLRSIQHLESEPFLQCYSARPGASSLLDARVPASDGIGSSNSDQPQYSDCRIASASSALSAVNHPMTTLLPDCQQYAEIDPLQDFSSFIDSVGLTLDSEGAKFHFPFSAEEPATLNDQYLGSNHFTSGLNNSSTEERMFSVRHGQEHAPSISLDGQATLQTDGSAFPEVVRNPVQTDSPWTISEERRRSLMRTLIPFRHVLHDFTLPSHHTLSRYYKSFVDQFHKHYPLLHLPTLRIDTCPLEMALIVAAIGAQYRFEARNGLSLYQASKAVALEQFKKREQRAHGSCQTKPPYLPSPSVSREHRHSVSPASAVISGIESASQSQPINIIRTLIMLIAFASWDWNAELLRDAFGFQSTLACCVREDGMRELSCSDNQDWHSWIQIEGARRTKLIAFAYLNVQVLAYNLPPVILNNEVELQLPCSTAEWEAHDPHEWENARKYRQGSDLFFQDALNVLLDRSQCLEAQQSLSYLSPLANFILLQALIQRICLIRQLSFPTGAALREGDLEEMESSLQRWKLAWQRTPGSSLDPQNLDGPLPFTSVAFLSLASVRLHIDLGPYRCLETRDPTQMAAALLDAPALKRSPRLIPALLHATHALSLPVTMGVQYVSRSQMFFWSCQHSLCGLESAVFLCKWLQSVAATLHVEPLTAHETTILNWVRSLVKEARESVELEELGITTDSSAFLLQPYQLCTIVLRIWAIVFGGNTMWAIINQIGSGLRNLAERIELEALSSNGR